MFKPADEFGLNVRLSIVLVLLVLLVTIAAFAPGGSIFRDTKAALFAGALALFLIVAAAGIPIRATKAHWAMAVFALVSIISVFTSVWPAESLIEVGVVLLYLTVFFTATNLVGGERLRLSATLLAIVGAVVAGAGLYKFFIGQAEQIEALRATGHEAQALQLETMAGRAFANFSSANSFAGLLVVLIPLALGLIIYEKDIRARIGVGLLLAVMTAGLFFSYSKGGLLALAMGLFVFLIGGLIAGGAKRAWLGGVLALVVGVPIYIFWAFFKFDLGKLADNIFGRVELWEISLDLIKSAWFLGIGPGAFGTQMTQFQGGSVFSRYAHNTYLQIAAESGLLGLGAFVIAIITLLVVSWRRISEVDKGEAWLRIGLIAGMAGFIVHNLVDYTWYVPGVALLFWFLAGLAVSRNDDSPIKGAPPTLGRSLLVAVLALSIVPALIVYVGASFAYQADGLKKGARINEASTAYENAIRYFPFNAEALDGLAQITYASHKKYGNKSDPGLLSDQQRAIQLRPTWPYYHTRLADTLALFGQNKEALNEYERSIELYPSDPALRVKAGNYLLDIEDNAGAGEMFASAVALSSVYDADNETSITIETARGDTAEPLRKIGYAYLGLARARVGTGKLSAAERAVDKAERLLGVSPGVLFVRGLILENRGLREEAIHLYKEADSQIATPDPLFSYHLALLLKETGDVKGAKRELKKLLEVSPNDAKAKLLLDEL